jgi:hypothetical protein
MLFNVIWKLPSRGAHRGVRAQRAKYGQNNLEP